MTKEVGLWIDHRKTVIVTIENKIVTTSEITSGMEKHVRFSNGSDAESSSDLKGSTAEDMRDRQFGNHLDKYYDDVVALIRDAESIWIFGPGEAKIELENRLKHAEIGARIVGIEPGDKMTNPQIVAKVINFYSR